MTTITLSGGAAMTDAQKTALRVEIGATSAADVSTAVATHVAAADPHPQYLTQTEGDARYAPAGISGATNLTTTVVPTGVTINSDTGTDAVIPLADATNAGVMAPAQVTKLAGLTQISVINDLTTGGTSAALSAEQGKTLKTQVDGKATTAQGAKADSALQPSAQLTQAAVTSATAAGVALLDAADAAAQRTALGLGTAATTAATAYATAAQGAKADTALQPGALPAGTTVTANQVSDAGAAGRDLLRMATLPEIQASVSGGRITASSVVIIGDSRAEAGKLDNGSQSGYFDVMMAKLGGRLRYIDNYAVGGKRLDHVLAEQVPSAVASGAKIWMMEAGYNDVNQGRTLAQMIDSWEGIYSACIAAGAVLFQGTSLPGDNFVGSAIKQATLTGYNNYLLAAAATRPGLYVGDGSAVVVDQATGGWIDGLQIAPGNDHCNVPGAWQVATAIYPLADSIFPRRPATVASVVPYEAISKNPYGLGTGGNSLGNVTGGANVPAGWEIKTNGSSAVTVSKVSRTYPKNGTAVRLTFTAGSVVDDWCYAESARVYIEDWSAGKALNQYDRVRYNGKHYMALNAGSISATDDRTTWPTANYQTVVSGGVTLCCVDKIDTGDKIVIGAEIDSANFNGQVGTVEIIFYWVGPGGIFGGGRSFATVDSSPVPLPTIPPQSDLYIQSLPLTLPAGIRFVIGAVRIAGRPGAVVDVARIFIRKA